MIKSYEFTGRTTEEAINAGLSELGIDISDAKVEIVEEGSKGLFGLFGSRPAKVKLSVEEQEEETESIFAHMLDVEAPKADKKQKAAPEKKKPQQNRKPRTEKTDEAAPAEKKETAPAPEKKVEEAPAAPVEPAPQADPGTSEGKAQQFLQELTKLMGVEVAVAVKTDEEGNVRVNMTGDSKGILIGRRGETLDALQYLTSLQVNKGQEGYTRVTLDTENYRAKREEALVRLANRMANKCQKTGRKVSLEAMNPYERRILHSALQNHPAVTTHSEGEEPNRRVIITLK
ncbi:MAG: hypothetical protein CW338_09445 [Clostridiales bacterium]|nr:hypothetical protein [Clostridiales bacterium]